MAAIRYYFDEHIAGAVAEGLRRRGIEVLTLTEAEMLGATDKAHFAFAREEGRTIVTQDDDFLRLAAQADDHAGRVAPLEIGHELARAPAWVLLAARYEQHLDGLRGAVRAVLRRAAVVGHRRYAAGAVAAQPLVARVATNAEVLAELGHGEEAFVGGENKLRALGHGVGAGPGHGSPARKQKARVRAECRACCRSKVPSIYPVCT